ncbi:MAG: hypothetical protein U0176_26885 [Bacteroidia bacterium]
MSNFLKICLLGLAHGFNDCAAGYMIGTLPSWAGGDWLEPGMLVLLYNALAFGGQVPAGLLVDRIGNARLVVVGCLAMAAIALAIFPVAPTTAISLVGVAGAFFHVAGGKIALLAFPGSAVGAGLFAAPGVMGLTMGGYWAWAGWSIIPGLMVAAAALLVLILVLKMPEGAAPPSPEVEDTFGWHDFLMVVLLLAIGLRSAIWNMVEMIHSGDHGLLVALGAAAFVGKIWGGFAAQWWGWRRYGVLALLIATPLLAALGNRVWALIPGIFLLQSATPAAVMGMYRLMPKLPATAVGMCFGMAIALGGIPMVMDWNPGLWIAVAALPLAGMGYWVALRTRVGN